MTTIKFNTKAELAKALLDGRKFLTADGDKLYYEEKNLHNSSPFLIKYEQGYIDAINSMWVNLLGEYLIELLPEHPHQILMDSYKEGQAWQYSRDSGANWEDCYEKRLGWYTPVWNTDNAYRLHPHNKLIRAFNNGAEIEYFHKGEWIDTNTPSWQDTIQYRIKTIHPHQALMDLAKANPRMKWQFFNTAGKCWESTKISPQWLAHNRYRPHPHWQLIIEAEDNPEQEWESLCPATKNWLGWVGVPNPVVFMEHCEYRKKQTTEVRYQYVYKGHFGGGWLVYNELLTEKEALDLFKDNYEKTGLTVEVPV